MYNTKDGKATYNGLELQILYLKKFYPTIP